MFKAKNYRVFIVIDNNEASRMTVGVWGRDWVETKLIGGEDQGSKGLGR